jgi:outer membrane protein TolC
VVISNAGGSPLDRMRAPYEAKSVAPVDFNNSTRIDSLLRAGQVYLSLQDAIALALENNLDIELVRFAPAIAGTDRQRAEGGGLLRGVTTSIRELPAGVGGPGSPLLTTVGGTAPATVVPSNFADIATITESSNDVSITGPFPFATGPAVPLYDPALVGQILGGHQSVPQNSVLNYGTNSLNSTNLTSNFTWQQGFATGTQFNVGYNSARSDSNSQRTFYNPYTTAALGINVTQPLLQGFSTAVNRRFITIARNNERIADNIFRQQLIDTVAGVIRLYWDLVSLNEDVKVKREELAAAEKLFEDNKSQVEVGTLAPLELKRAQAEVARSRQDLFNSEGLVAQQELLIKNVLTRNGAADSRLREAHIVPLDHIEVPSQEKIEPVQDLLARAFDNRPDVAQARVQIDNSQISLKGSKNALLPSLDLIGSLQNNALSGPISSNYLPSTGLPLQPTIDPLLVGGGGNLLSQVFSRNFPNYAIGLQLTVPIRNRVAQADVVRDELQVRQTEVRLQQLNNSVKLEVENALVALQRARASYQAAVETRQLQEEALAAEQERFTVGASTTFFLIQYQRDLAQARSTEVAVQGIYAKVRAALDRALGTTLLNNNVQLDEAYRGQVSRPPSPLPVVP